MNNQNPINRRTIYLTKKTEEPFRKIISIVSDPNHWKLQDSKSQSTIFPWIFSVTKLVSYSL